MSKTMPDSELEIFELEKEARAAEIRLAARAKHVNERHELHMQNLKKKWPLAAGLVLACLAPWIRDLADLFAPWGRWILLPAVSLVDCKQLPLGSGARSIAGQFALYAQFPIEAVVIRSVLKERVNVRAVAGQLVLFHALAVVFLWLLSRSAAH